MENVGGGGVELYLFQFSYFDVALSTGQSKKKSFEISPVLKMEVQRRLVLSPSIILYSF
jgi:hypothetical protein